MRRERVRRTHPSAIPQKRRIVCSVGGPFCMGCRPALNGRLVRVGSQRPNGRFETVRPGSGRNLAVRPANLRVLLEEFNGRAAGDTMDFDDGEIVLLGFDAQESYWACQKAHMYLWIPAYNFR